MIANLPRVLLFFLFLGFSSYASSGETPTEVETPTEDTVSTGEDALAGDSQAGEERYNQTCVNCHGTAGKGVASYPKISGKEISYTKSMLEKYRDGIKVGPNSSLMIMMAKPLTDEEIANLAAYLKDASQ